MRVIIGFDHAGLPLESLVVEHVRSLGHEVIDARSHDGRRVDKLHRMDGER